MPLRFDEIKESKSKLKSLTSLTIAEFTALSAVFNELAERHFSRRSLQWRMRKRIFTFRKNSIFKSFNDMLLFILTYLKTNPTQSVFAAQNNMQQADVSRWVERLEPLLTKALKKMKMAPATKGETLKEVLKETKEIYLDATERTIARPKNHLRQKRNYSGKKNDIPLKTP